MTTMTWVKQEAMKADTALLSARKAKADAEAALAAAVVSSREFRESATDTDAAREKALRLDLEVRQAETSVVRSGFAIRRAEQAAADARARLERCQAVASALDAYAKAEQAARDADFNIAAAVQEFVDTTLAKLFEKRDAALAAAVEKFNALPTDVRVLDVNQPAMACVFFGATRLDASEVLARAARVLPLLANAAVGKPHKAVGARPTPWAGEGRA